MGNFKIKRFTGGESLVSYDKEPNMCPFCHHTITPIRCAGYANIYGLEIIYVCSNSKCQRTFIGVYLESGQVYRLDRVSVGTHKPRTFSDNIQTVSPNFVDIYNQALTSEHFELNHISGIGYRKALEFLIKDYLIFKKPEKEVEIKSKLLGKCIKDDIDNQNLSDIAERAAWLGNDETHYVRKWEDKDIQDLKVLIDVAVHWIEMEMLTEKYKAEMN